MHLASCENSSDDENVVLFPFCLFSVLLFLKTKTLRRGLIGYGQVRRRYNFREAYLGPKEEIK